MLVVPVATDLLDHSASATSPRSIHSAPSRMADAAHTVTQQPRRHVPTPAEAVVRGWRSSLRHQNQQPSPPSRGSPTRTPTAPAATASLGSTNNQTSYRRTRPPSSGVSSNRLSSNPSLLSLEPPVSPTTTVASRAQYPGSTASQTGPASTAPSVPRSTPTAPAPSQQLPRPRYPPTTGVQGPGRHAAQLNRVYDKPKYDADYDRGASRPKPTSASAAAGSSSTPTLALFDPNAPRQSHPVHVSAGPDRRKERELREDGSVRRPRSKRDVVEPQDLGRRGVQASKDSLESVETDFSGRTKSSSGGAGKRRRRRDGDGLDDGEAGEAASRRQLFDPRRDDPNRFNASSNSLPIPTSTQRNLALPVRASTASDNRSVAGMSIASFNSAYSGTSDAVDVDDAASINTTNSGRPSTSDPVLANLKRAYREIMELEKKLQDEHRAAMVARDKEDDDQYPAKGIRLHGTSKNGSGAGKFDDEYWVRLANNHKQLADAHYSFLQLSLDPRLPASHHILPQKYNIPTRLWQVAFHQLLERMRHAVLAAPLSGTRMADSDDAPSTNVLEHLIEFIQYAYGHYSQLFEDPTVAVFRAAWIEQLGDLARYRMAVAGLASRVHAAQQQAQQRESQQLTSGALASATHSVSPDSTPIRREDAASIGQAALNDWDLEEQESWREIARDWYAQGLAETPGTGRLQHHLALLSRGEGDELKGLYHYAKSLTAAHPYLSARESILPLFDQEHQSRRTLPDVGKSELFVHLHGMLFTKISLDDWDDCLGRFVERLQEEGWAMGKGIESPGHDSTVYGDKEWFMLAVVNISAMMQYGTEDGILKKLTTKEPAEKPTRHRQPSNRQAPSKVAPQAIMLNSARQQQDDESVAPESDVVKQLVSATPKSIEDDPLTFKLAQRLSVQLLEFTLSQPARQLANAELPNPYLVLILTFLSHMTFHPEAFRHLERSVPWQTLADFFNRFPPVLEIRIDTPAKITSSRGTPLPEDWCIRGMDWAGRQLFGRGYWRTDSKKGPRSGARDGYAESMLPPPIEGVDGTTLRVESEMDALKFDLAALDEEDGLEEEDGLATAFVLSEARWRRLATTAAWMVRNVPGFDYDPNARDDEPKFTISGPLRVKIARWRQEDEDAKEAERLSQLSLRDRGSADEAEEELDDEESDDEDDEDEDDSPAVKELKARRRQLKAVIRSARASRATSSGGRKSKLSAKNASLPKVFPGYTVLVFDTNILLTSIKLFSELVEAECWTIVVPLAVVTELDGLKRNETPLGLAAAEVIEYLERAVRTHSRYLKIQTSRGNYLKDLAIRNESIDFAQTHDSLDSSDPLFSHDSVRNMDDVILRAVAWQKDHFTSRLALVNPRAIAERKKVGPETAPVVLVTFDRNLRLKARARQLDAADEKELKKVLEVALLAG